MFFNILKYGGSKMVIRKRTVSYGVLTLEKVSIGYVIKLNGNTIKGVYGPESLDGAIRDFESMPN